MATKKSTEIKKPLTSKKVKEAIKTLGATLPHGYEIRKSKPKKSKPKKK